MSKSLKECTKLESNNDSCVVLSVVSGNEMELVKMGCFNGDETMFRLTKGENVTCTVWSSNGKHFSWHWGMGGYTLVSDNVEKKGRMIQQCIERDYGIKCQI